MGQAISCCSANIFNELKERYGEDFAKLMVAEKAKDVLGQQFQNTVGKVNGIFKELEGKASGIVDGKKEEVNKIYSDLKAKVNSTIPGGVNALEKIKGESIDQFSGYNSLQSKINDIKLQAFSKIQGQKGTVITQLNSKKQGMINQIEQERPKLALYEQLPTPVQAHLRKQAETVFADQLSKNKESIIEELSKSANAQNVEKLFAKISPEGPLQGVVGQAFSLFSSVLGQGGIGNAIGNALDSGLKFLKR